MCCGPRDCGCGEHHSGDYFRVHGHYMRHPPPLMSLEDEIKMLEDAKASLENKLKIINERLEKLKA